MRVVRIVVGSPVSNTTETNNIFVVAKQIVHINLDLLPFLSVCMCLFRVDYEHAVNRVENNK